MRKNKQPCRGNDPENGAVDVDSLGIDWERAKEDASRMKQLPIDVSALDDVERDLTGLLSSEAFENAVKAEDLVRTAQTSSPSEPSNSIT